MNSQAAKPPAARHLLRLVMPQKVRTRLALVYAGLFLAGGSALLGLTYGLMAANLPTANPFTRPTLTRAEFLKVCKNPAHKSKLPTKAGNTKSSTPEFKVALLCDQTYLAYEKGFGAGSSSQRDRALSSLLFYSLVGLAMMTAVSGGAGWVVSGRVLRPVRVITETARRASEQHLGERIGLTGARDELKELADTFDDMLERLDQAFATQRRFVADASHELRTPLTLMRTAIDVTLAKPAHTVEQLEAMAVRVRASIDRAERMIDALLTLAVSDRGRLATAAPFDLATAADDALDAAAAEIERLGLQVDCELVPAQTTGEPHLLERMIGNLVDNAVRHNRPGGHVMLASGVLDGSAFVRITNSGPVVPVAVVPTLFEPFRRLSGRSGSRDGVGLGLAIAKSIASAHGATLAAESLPAGGLAIQVTMPRYTVEAPGPPAAVPR